jgi:hypothetical protein
MIIWNEDMLLIGKELANKNTGGCETTLAQAEYRAFALSLGD